MGHSFGAKVAMHYALLNPKHVSKLIIVDMSPVHAHSDSSLFRTYTDAMLLVKNVKSQSEADSILSKYIPEQSIRQFLLTNLKKSDNGYYSWYIILINLGDAIYPSFQKI
jgi:esterase